MINVVMTIFLGILTCSCMSAFFLNLSATLCHRTFLFLWFTEKRSVSTDVERKSNEYHDGHITIPRLNNSFQKCLPAPGGRRDIPENICSPFLLEYGAGFCLYAFRDNVHSQRIRQTDYRLQDNPAPFVFPDFQQEAHINFQDVCLDVLQEA